MSKLKEKFEKLYEKQGKAPWTYKDPPKELVELVESEKIKPCKVLDVGCGEGYYSIYLASKGFHVKGIDFSERAIQYAKQHAKESGVSCNFIVMDRKDLDKIIEKFDFIFEWRSLNEIIIEEDRKKYVIQVKRLLNKEGKYLSVSFNNQSDLFGKGKLRKTDKDITLYFASIEDLERLFEPFRILEKKLIKVGEKEKGEALANYFFMEKP